MRFAANGQSTETGSRKGDWIDTQDDRKLVEQGRTVTVSGDREFKQAVDAETGELLWVYVKTTEFVVITGKPKGK
jgi:outer membrane protein assembly factor BamB